jgi:hypothetical protein
MTEETSTLKAIINLTRAKAYLDGILGIYAATGEILSPKMCAATLHEASRLCYAAALEIKEACREEPLPDEMREAVK